MVCSQGTSHIIVSGNFLTTENEKASKKVERYSIKKDSWKELPELTVGRAFHGTCCLQNVVYVFAGMSGSDNKALNSIEKLDLELVKSNKRQGMPAPLWTTIVVPELTPTFQIGATVLNNSQILLFGGAVGEEPQNTL